MVDMEILSKAGKTVRELALLFSLVPLCDLWFLKFAAWTEPTTEFLKFSRIFISSLLNTQKY